MEVTLSEPAGVDLRRMAQAAYPNEGCGVLVGTWQGDRVDVTEAVQGRNLVTDRRHDRYELDPGDIVRAERSARERGLDVVGFWHTHPDHPARPSRFDTERAWPEYIYVICGVTRAGVEAIGAFRLGDDGEFTEVSISDAGGGAAGRERR